MRLFKRPGKDDESIIEVSNDNGDHWVAHVPTNQVRNIEKELRNAGCERDNDEEQRFYRNNSDMQRYVDERDHDKYRFRSERIINESEDLEDSYDRENDDSDREPNEQPAWRWW